MNSVQQPKPRADWRPLAVLLAVVAVLTARWIAVAGIGDFGWTYELGMRIRLGEVPYRDFVCALPQLTSYTIIPFLGLTNNSLWAFALHLYLWWLAALLVGLQVVRVLGLRPVAQAAALFFAACLSLPALHLGHAYSYAATAFFGLALLQLLQHRQDGRVRHLLAAGVWAGLTVFAKQNIGPVALLLGFGLLTLDAVQRRQFAGLWRHWVWFGVGAAIVLLPGLAYFASHAGLREVLLQMFHDAGAGKGGVRRMVFNLIPMWFFTPGTPHRHLISALVSGGVLAIFLTLLGRRLLAVLRCNTPAPATPETFRCGWRVIVGSIGLVAALSVASALDLPAVREFFARLHPAAMYGFQGFTFPLFFLGYAFFTAVGLICLSARPHWRKPEVLVPLLAFLLILWGHEMSCEGYLPLGAPLVVPLGMLLLETTGVVRNTVPLACAGGVILICGLSASTNEFFYAASFKPLERLPAGSKFAGMWALPTYAKHIREMQQEVAPRIQDHSTLWVHVGGPHLAWGGKPVFAPATMHLDTYHVRSEAAFREHWAAQPPEFVFVGYQTPCIGSQLFTPEALQRWLPERYEVVWQSSIYAHPAALWQLRASTHTIAR